MSILLVAALLPAVALMIYVYRRDRVESEPAGLVFRVFMFGALSGLVAGFIENILFAVFESVIPPSVLLIVIEYFIGVAAVEEACKYAALNTVRKNPAFDYVFDAIVYAVAAALGFAALENVFYVLDGGLEVALTRAIFSVPGHMADGVVMGAFFGLARKRELHGNKAGARTYYFLAFLLPVIEHGFYDTALSLDSDAFTLLALGVDIVFIGIAFLLVRNISKNDSRLHPSSPTPGVSYGGQQQPMPFTTAHPQQPPYPVDQQQAYGYQQAPQTAQQTWQPPQQQGTTMGNAPEPPQRRSGPTVRYSSKRR